MDLQMITLQMNQLCFTKNSIKFTKLPGAMSSYKAPGNSVGLQNPQNDPCRQLEILSQFPIPYCLPTDALLQ